MVQRTVTVASRVGLHARPAKILTQAAAASGLRVTVGRPGATPVDAASILMVMALGVHHGEQVTLTAEGPAAAGVLDDLAALVETDLDEPAQPVPGAAG